MLVVETMQSPLVVWTPTKSSSTSVDGVSEELSSTEDCVARRLRVSSDEQGATEASSDDVGLELAAMQACYVQLKHLVPTVPLNVELSSLQLLQHVIDYIVDLELALHSSASASSSPRRHDQQQQQPEKSSCRGRGKTATHSKSSSTAASADERNNACDITCEMSHRYSPRSPCTSRTLCDTERHPSQLCRH